MAHYLAVLSHAACALRMIPNLHKTQSALTSFTGYFYSERNRLTGNINSLRLYVISIKIKL